MSDHDDLADADPFRVVELTRVTNEDIERELNRMHAEGYALHDMRFAMQQGVRRPAMAFLIFERADSDELDAEALGDDAPGV